MLDLRVRKPKPKPRSLYSQYLDWKAGRRKYQPHQGQGECARRLSQQERAQALAKNKLEREALECLAIKRAFECYHCACYQLGGGCCHCERNLGRCVEM